MKFFPFAMSVAVLSVALTGAAVADAPVEELFKQGNAEIAAGHDDVAFKLFQQAAVRGDPYSQYNLAMMYAKGQGAAQDNAKAKEWLTKAADQNFAPAVFTLGQADMAGDLWPKDVDGAVKWWTRGADLGDAYSQTNLADLYDQGLGVAENHQKALDLRTQAAEKGDTLAQSQLGATYMEGKYVARDPVMAEKWWRSAAQCGDAEAQRNLGLMYVHGDGVPKDAVQAYAWLSTAYKLGDNNAIENLNQARDSLSGAQLDDAQKLSEKYSRDYGSACEKPQNG